MMQLSWISFAGEKKETKKEDILISKCRSEIYLGANLYKNWSKVCPKIKE